MRRLFLRAKMTVQVAIEYIITSLRSAFHITAGVNMNPDNEDARRRFSTAGIWTA
ncbi:MAG: hypothetical protein MZV63_53430 [Marinilabiliales bacterium]|nr:hypothetical protein [Marinilabiliales bacterium]